MCESKDTDYETELIPLSWIIDKWLLVAPQIRAKNWGTCDAGPYYALDTALRTLKYLYFLRDPRWQEVCEKIQIGFIKDTKEYGNTSVSMGAAASSHPMLQR